MTIRKCVSLAPLVTPLSQANLAPADIRRKDQRFFFKDTNTGWIRIWADWAAIEPGSEGHKSTKLLQALKENVVAARKANLKIVLVTYRFPPWANDTQGWGATTPPADEVQSFFDRGPVPHAGDTVTSYKARNLTSLKDRGFRWPADLSATSAYGRWLRWLMTYLHPVNQYGDPHRLNTSTAGDTDADLAYRWVDMLEFTNEPNLQMFPLYDPFKPYDPGTLLDKEYWKRTSTIPTYAISKVARMMQTAITSVDAVNASANPPSATTAVKVLRILGPGTADTDHVIGVGPTDTIRHSSGYGEFTSGVISALNLASGTDPFVAPAMGWSHHCYNDFKDHDTGRIQDVRSKLVSHFAGYPGSSATNPGMWLTEGGYHRPNNETLSVPADSDQTAAMTTIKNVKKLAYVQMLTQFLFYTTKQYDSGLCNRFVASSTPLDVYERPAYGRWKSLL